MGRLAKSGVVWYTRTGGGAAYPLSGPPPARCWRDARPAAPPPSIEGVYGGITINIVFFDLESTDLSASWGRILCASFVSLSGEAYTFRADKRPWKGRETIDDSKLSAAIRDELERADIIVSWNGILFDVPLLNARLQVAGDRPMVGKRWPNGAHLDLMYYAGGQSLRIGSRKLDNVAKFFSTGHQKTPLDGLTWQRAAAGDKGAMESIVEHCEADVLVLREVFPKLAPHVKKLVLPMSAWWKHAEEIQL